MNKHRPKFRIKEFDIANDIWLLQKRVFFVFWMSVSVGSMEKLEKLIGITARQQ